MLTDEDLRIFLDGVDQADCDFSRESLVLDGKPVRLAPAVDVADNLAHLQYFRKISRAVVERGEQYQSDGDPEMALRCYEGVVKFGGDIERGRESLLQVFLGAAVQKSGARKLKEFYENTGDAERSRQWSDFLIDLDEFSGRFKEKMKKLKIAAGFGSEMAANGLWILENDDDHVFRREALAGLGAAKVFAPSIIGPPLERTAANDPDPYVREAAKNALRFGDTANERRQ
jgi:hypothetical protein